MERLLGLSVGKKLVLGAGALLFIDTFLTWQSYSPKIAGITVVSVTANAWHGFWGVFLGLLTIAILIWVAGRALGVEIPEVGPEGITTLALGALILVFAVLKTITESYSAWASYVGIVLAAGVAYGSWLVFQDTGESLPSMATQAPPAPPADEEPPSDPAGTTPA